MNESITQQQYDRAQQLREFTVEITGYGNLGKYTFFAKANSASKAREIAAEEAREQGLQFPVTAVSVTGSRLLQETVIDVAVWDDQVGGWFDIKSCPSVEEAREHVAGLREEDEREGVVRRYQIVTTITEEA